MSIEVSCECGKRFSVGDQYAGKRGRCKACGRVVTVPAAEPPEYTHELADDPIPEAKVAVPTESMNARGPALPAYPSFHRRNRGHADKAARVSIHVNPVIVVLVLLAIGIPTGIFLVEQGPVKARNQLEKIEPTAEGNIASQITRAIQHEYARFAFGDEDMGISRHKALNVVFEDPVIVLHLPESLQIQGRTTEGNYKGQFHPRTMRFEADVPITGGMHKVDGSVSDEDQSLNLDGKKIN
ncbi:MAG: hypothetical protein ABSB74_05870 [Tepidisphaeraceae bacterium]